MLAVSCEILKADVIEVEHSDIVSSSQILNEGVHEQDLIVDRVGRVQIVAVRQCGEDDLGAGRSSSDVPLQMAELMSCNEAVPNDAFVSVFMTEAEMTSGHQLSHNKRLIAELPAALTDPVSLFLLFPGLMAPIL
ncbi:hypothetical protein J6590_058835 [Homalodisca vitripennis]|nr:hypothetical protein J6590_058835 [Homalodisca vitripennis]